MLLKQLLLRRKSVVGMIHFVLFPDALAHNTDEPRHFRWIEVAPSMIGGESGSSGCRRRGRIAAAVSAVAAEGQGTGMIEMVSSSFESPH